MIGAKPAARSLCRVAPLAVVLAAACGDNNKGTATPKTPPGTTTSSGTTPTANGGGKSARKPKLVMGKRNLFPLLVGRISPYAPTQVQGISLKIIALAGPQSFWAGRSHKQRILVTLRLKGGSAPKITLGQQVDFIGLLTVSPADAGALGVRNHADRTLLQTQGAYVDASAADVKLH